MGLPLLSRLPALNLCAESKLGRRPRAAAPQPRRENAAQQGPPLVKCPSRRVFREFPPKAEIRRAPPEPNRLMRPEYTGATAEK